MQDFIIRTCVLCAYNFYKILLVKKRGKLGCASESKRLKHKSLLLTKGIQLFSNIIYANYFLHLCLASEMNLKTRSRSSQSRDLMKLLQYVEWYLVTGKRRVSVGGGKITDVTKWPLITQNGPATLHYFHPLFLNQQSRKSVRRSVRSLN